MGFLGQTQMTDGGSMSENQKKQSTEGNKKGTTTKKKPAPTPISTKGTPIAFGEDFGRKKKRR